MEEAGGEVTGSSSGDGKISRREWGVLGREDVHRLVAEERWMAE